jgi:multidrug resistance efflux pump
MRSALKVLATALVVLVAVGATAIKYRDYVTNPWTRNGQVRAQVIQIAPRVSGPIVELPIVDNRLVEQGRLLFGIDPRTYQAALDRAHAELDQTRNEILSLSKQVEAEKAVVESAKAGITQGEAAVEAYGARVIEARKERDRQRRLNRRLARSSRRRPTCRPAWIRRSTRRPSSSGQRQRCSRRRRGWPRPRPISGRPGTRTPGCARPRRRCARRSSTSTSPVSPRR